jgi:hypothetical protein
VPALEKIMSLNEGLSSRPAAPADDSVRVKQLDSVATAVFFIWIGLAVLVQIGWPWSLFGVGLILIGHQAALWRMGEKMNGFRLVCGAVFLFSAVWGLLGMTWPLVPVLLILIGIGSLWNAVFGVKSG